MKKFISLILLIFANALVAYACFWDRDTLEMERQQFPNIMELISGKFLRHSPEYHIWRIKDRTKKLKQYPDSLSLYDDLAVSFSKLGDDKKAILIAQKKEKLKPGLYETYANLGTFYLHDGDFKKGIEFIDKAIKINPDAHFGREIYQKHLAEYILSKKENNKIPLPLEIEIPYVPGARNNRAFNFYSFLLKKYKARFTNPDSINNIYKLPEFELNKAIKGVSGMVKFGNHDSPILMEVLGDLLLNSAQHEGARQLAAMAYLRAAYQVKEDGVKNYYKKKSLSALLYQEERKNGREIPVTISAVERILKKSIKEAEAFYNEIRTNEINWIKAGKNPEINFANTYYSEPKISNLQIEIKNTDDSISRYFQYITQPSFLKKGLSSNPSLNVDHDSLTRHFTDSIYVATFGELPKEEIKEDEKELKVKKVIKPEKPSNKVFLIGGLVLLIIGVFLFLYFKK